MMDLLDTILFGPARLVAVWPYAGVAIFAMLVALQLLVGRRSTRPFLREAPVFAGILWLIFNAYELQVGSLAADGKGFLRIDLIVLVPILYALTVAALLSAWRQYRERVATPDQREK